jgi:hypothetical protein
MEDTYDKISGVRFSLAVVIPAIVTVFYTAFATNFIETYGFALFVLTPVLMGFISAVILRPVGLKQIGIGLLANMLSIVLIGFLIMAFAIEGLICLFMALPLAIPLDMFGLAVGYIVVNSGLKPRSMPLCVLFCISIPLILGFEAANPPEPVVHEVVSTVEIDAPIDLVWKNVIAFPRIDKEPDGILKLGFAYPIEAVIEGSGVGAIRYCNFNTGPFVEPITVWHEPDLLAFDVKAQPAPMIEMSPYEHLSAAHLEYLHSQRGQFRLYELNGKTVVEGTTFYTHEIAPDVYWKLYSDEIIHQIHMRVLDHIKEVSEMPIK